jgi:hypothetical protein
VGFRAETPRHNNYFFCPAGSETLQNCEKYMVVSALGPGYKDMSYEISVKKDMFFKRQLVPAGLNKKTP